MVSFDGSRLYCIQSRLWCLKILMILSCLVKPFFNSNDANSTRANKLEHSLLCLQIKFRLGSFAKKSNCSFGRRSIFISARRKLLNRTTGTEFNRYFCGLLGILFKWSGIDFVLFLVNLLLLIGMLNFFHLQKNSIKNVQNILLTMKYWGNFWI